MAFHEVRFPTGIGFGSSGGPERRTQIVTLASGREARNATWADSRRRYNAGYGVRGVDDLHAVIAFFEARSGRLHGFRFKDWTDYRSSAPGTMPVSLRSSRRASGSCAGGSSTRPEPSSTWEGRSNWRRPSTSPRCSQRPSP